jgi:hypothetical protein
MPTIEYGQTVRLWLKWTYRQLQRRNGAMWIHTAGAIGNQLCRSAHTPLGKSIRHLHDDIMGIDHDVSAVASWFEIPPEASQKSCGRDFVNPRKRG